MTETENRPPSMNGRIPNRGFECAIRLDAVPKTLDDVPAKVRDGAKKAMLKKMRKKGVVPSHFNEAARVTVKYGPIYVLVGYGWRR